MIRLDIIEEHIEEADFLWQQRNIALASRDYNFDELGGLEERLLAHLDGLLVGGNEAWELLGPKIASREVGEVFAATFTALESRTADKVDHVQKAFTTAEGETLEGIRHGMYHTAYLETEKLFGDYHNLKSNNNRAVVVDILSFRRTRELEPHLGTFLNDEDPVVVASAIEAIGRLRSAQYKDRVEQLLNAGDSSICYAAMRTGLLLGSKKAINACRKAVADQRAEANSAVILLGLAGLDEDLPTISNAIKDAKSSREAITALGTMGKIGAMDELIRYATDPSLSRLTGEAVYRITGVDLEKEELIVQGPVDPEIGGENKEEDDFVEDLDEGLPIPDPTKLEIWWRRIAPKFAGGIRYRHGQPHGREILIEILKNGSLPERHDAAFELTLEDMSCPYLETYAFTTQQRRVIDGLVHPATGT